MRTFQYSDAKSHKFWNIEVSGNAFTVTYGKIGAAGQTQTKTFPTPEKAQAEADKLVKEKTGKGYVETTPKAGGTVSEGEAFEKALLANPHDGTAWRAYADYLTEQNDPRGEFMQVQFALEDEGRPAAERKKLQAREKALLKKHEREWLGDLAPVLLDAEPVTFWRRRGGEGTRPPVEYTFAGGWLSRLEFHRLTVNQARVLNKTPQAKLLRELVVETVEYETPAGSTEQYIESHYEPGPDVPASVGSYEQPALHALSRCPHLKSVRVFQLGEGDRGAGDTTEYHNCHTNGAMAYHLIKQMPHAEELYLFAHRVDANKIFPLPMPELKILQLYHSHSYPLDKLAANKSLTNLTHLLCHPHALEYDEEEGGGAYIRLAHVRAICRSPHLQKLTHLQLRLTDFGDKGVREIVDSGILKRLKVLDLQSGCVTDEGAKALAACPDIKNLEFLNLKSNALTKTGEAAIKATKVKADVSGQHGQTKAFNDDEAAEFLYEGDIE